jgi:RNA recognition motif-containing protein
MSTELNNSRLIVNYLPYSLSDEGFKAMFSKIGPLESCKLMKTPDGHSLAYGFVEYKSPDHGLQAIETYNGVEKDGKKMKVSIAKPKGSHGSTRKTTTLYIADLPEEATETTVREVFEKVISMIRGTLNG